MENTAILDLDYTTFSRIKNILEDPNTMKSFLEILPSDCSCEDVLTSMSIESQKYNMTPAKYLLMLLGSKGYRISHLIEWFEAINLEKALIYLKKEESIKIVEHPHAFVEINEGEELLLVCRAQSYPLPDYLWYKNDEPLLLEVESVLSIKNTSIEDDGTYTCLVTKWNSQINQYEWLYSNFSTVKVIPKDVLPFHPFSEPSFSQSLCVQSNIVSENNNEKIVIIKQPYINGKLAQGMSVCLICEAISNYALSYQWFQNGEPLFGENSPQLILNYLYPDPDTGENKWNYQCKINNLHYEIMSNVVVVELDEANDSTPFFAEQKIALMIANDTYDHLENLVKPSTDVCDVATLLSSMNFKILPFKNLTLTEMRNAIDLFCRLLKPGSYALFFFAGHGFEIYGQTYMQPTDCSNKYLLEESICAEYLLQCMQETKPALNVFLLDCCRRLPPTITGSSKCQRDIPAGMIFQGKMENNTIYGYSTSFLNASYESDIEVNSIFVKYLKKYLTLNKSIEDILDLVKKDFAKDPLTKNIQHPVIKTSLSEPRKLCDPVPEIVSAMQFPFWDWYEIKRKITSKVFNLTNLNAVITIDFNHHMEVFCNGIDIVTYLYVQPNANMQILEDIEINVELKVDDLKLLPADGILLKNANLEKTEKKLLFKKELLYAHKLISPKLDGIVLLKFCSKNVKKDIEFSIDVSKLSELQLSVNHLQSYNVEYKSYSIIKNLFK